MNRSSAPADSAFVIFNPTSGRGRAERRRERFLELLRRHLRFEIVQTAGPGQETALVARALEDGFRRFVAVGGDGTWSLVADALVRSGRRDVALGLLPAGTGNDFGKTVGVTWERAEESVRAVAEGRALRIDVGRVGKRHFLNVVGFGFDIAVIEDALTVPVLRGDALYRFCALRQLFRFPGLDIELADGDGRSRRSRQLMLIIANARIFGGSFRIAPAADLADGKLDAVAIGNAGPLGRARIFGKVSKGTHVDAPIVEIRQSVRFRATFEQPVRFEMDGEVYTSEGNTVETVAVPDALTLLVPGGTPGWNGGAAAREAAGSRGSAP